MVAVFSCSIYLGDLEMASFVFTWIETQRQEMQRYVNDPLGTLGNDSMNRVLLFSLGGYEV